MMPEAPQTCARQISPDSGSPLSLFLASALLYSQVNSDSLNCPESESFPRAPLISLPSAAVVPHSRAGHYMQSGDFEVVREGRHAHAIPTIRGNYPTL